MNIADKPPPCCAETQQSKPTTCNIQISTEQKSEKKKQKKKSKCGAGKIITLVITVIVFIITGHKISRTKWMMCHSGHQDYCVDYTPRWEAHQTGDNRGDNIDDISHQ